MKTKQKKNHKNYIINTKIFKSQFLFSDSSENIKNHYPKLEFEKNLEKLR